ncbi:MAG: histidine phosphatase family protein [Lachnospiraceae bacterium]|nr:histidine phosphatase family protein [Lachnospiraceae bacterium]MDD6504009.1 histidine phosphatase family protein [Lachnospiraceae bacterium]
MRLYIIRHGETSWNTRKRLQGQRDIMLNENGVKLAEETAKGMKDVDIDLVISSPLIRAKETAGILMSQRELPMITDRRLTEMSFGQWEGESMIDSTVISPEFRKKFLTDPMHCVCPPGGETFEKVLARTADFYRWLISNKAYENANILISTHGAAGRCLLAAVDGERDNLWRGGVPRNCAVSIVEVENGVGKIVELDKLYYHLEV